MLNSKELYYILKIILVLGILITSFLYVVMNLI
jgi:hypothetical protein